MRDTSAAAAAAAGAAAAAAAAEACNAQACRGRFAVIRKPALPGMAATRIAVATLQPSNPLLQNIGWAAAFDDALAYRAANEIGDA